MKHRIFITIITVCLAVLAVHAEYRLGTVKLKGALGDVEAEALIDTGNHLVILGNGQNACISQYTLSELTIPGKITVDGVECSVVINQLAFRLCNSLVKVYIGEGVTSIGDFAFVGCSLLSYLSLPSTLEHIGSGALVDLPALRIVESQATTAPKWGYSDVFAYEGTKAATSVRANMRKLYVPRGSGVSYRMTRYGSVGWADAFGLINEAEAPSLELEISTLKELKAIRRNVNDGTDSYAAYTIRLTADIVLDGDTRSHWQPWEPIGTPERPFKGVFDGGGHIIKNLRSDDIYGTANVGLFGCVEGASIGNLFLQNISMSGTDNVGVVVGSGRNSQLHDILIYDAVSTSGETFYCAQASAGSAGGLAGRLENSTVDNCYVYGKVRGTVATGGVVGFCEGAVEINDCAAAYSVENTSSTGAVGGIVGLSTNGAYVTRSYSRCVLSGAATAKGGIVGVYSAAGVDEDVISNCAYLDETGTLPVATTSGTGSFTATGNRRCSSLGQMKSLGLIDVLEDKTWYFFHDDMSDYPIPSTLVERYLDWAGIKDAAGFVYAPIGDPVSAYTIIGYDGTEVDINIPIRFRGQKVTAISDFAFMGSNVERVIIPGTITSIGERAFADCRSLNNIYIGSDVSSEYNGWLEGCLNLRNIDLASSNKTYVMENGVLYNAAKTELIRCKGERQGTFVLPESVVKIMPGAFANCDRLVWVDMRQSAVKWTMNRTVPTSPFYRASQYTLFLMNSISSVAGGEPNVVYNNSQIGDESYCQRLLISEKLKFLTPVQFNAATIEYDRPLRAGLGYESGEESDEVHYTLKAKGYTVCLPFIPEVWTGEGVKVYSFDRVAERGGNTYVYFDEVPTTRNGSMYNMHANFPYLVMVDGENTYELSTKTVSKVQVVNDDTGGNSIREGFNYKGTTSGASNTELSDAVLPVYLLRDDGNWTKVEEYKKTDEVKPFQCYFQATDEQTNAAVLFTAFSDLERMYPTVQLRDLEDNSQVLELYGGQTVNVEYDRVLSATKLVDGTWISRAFTVCLPYDVNMLQNWTDRKVSVYRFHSINDSNELNFSTDKANTGILEAGHAYLIVVNQGSVSLDGYGVKLKSKPAEGAEVLIESLDPTKSGIEIGRWVGIFTDQTNEWAVSHRAFGLSSDGVWEAYRDTEARYRQIYPRGMRGLFCLTEPTGIQRYPIAYVAAAGPGETEEPVIGEFVGDYDIDTGIIHVKEDDGSHRYFDLHGHPLPGRPDKGIYIDNGKKLIKK